MAVVIVLWWRDKNMRIVQIQITYDLLTEIFTEGWEAKARCIKGLPKGAKLVRTFNDTIGNYAVLTFEHPSFDEVPLGQYPPVIDCWYETVNSGCECGVTK